MDVIWVRNPIPFFQKYPDVDVLTSSDHLRETVKDERLEKWPDAGSAFNIGAQLPRGRAALAMHATPHGMMNSISAF